jgi:hypothetical protein
MTHWNDIHLMAIGIINADDKKIKSKIGVEISDDELKSFDK